MTILEQAREINQKREHPYYIQPQSGKFAAQHNGQNNKPQVFDTIAEAREFIQDTVIEDQILQDEINMDIY